MAKIEKMYEGNIRTKYLVYAIPLILTALLSQSYAFVDSMMIGKFIGSQAFAATSATDPFIQLVSSIYWGYHAGFSIYTAFLFGRNAHERMLDMIKINTIISTFFMLLISICCNVWHKELFAVLNVSSELYGDALSYFSVYMWGLVVFQFASILSSTINALGLTKLPLLVSIVSGVINVIGNYVAIKHLNLGIAGCALASVISNIVSCVVYSVKIVSVFHTLNLKILTFKFRKSDFKTSLGYAFPTMLQQITMTSCAAIVSPLTNTCGTAAISGYNIANKAKTLLMALYQNSNKANTTYVAQTMGAGKIKKIKEGIKVGTTQTMLFFIPVMLLFIIFAKNFSGLFLDLGKDNESINYSVNIMRYILPFVFFNVFNNLFHGIFRATGSGKYMFISTLVYTVSMILYSYIFYYVFPENLRIYGIYLGFAGAWFTEALFATIVYFIGIWKTPEYKELEKKMLEEKAA